MSLEVVFDSSFLMAVAETPTTWFEDIVQEVGKVQPTVLECVVQELAGIAKREGRKSRAARVAGDLASSFERAECEGGAVDECMISHARRSGGAVATVDGEMIRRLKRSKVKVLTLHKGRVAVA